MEMWNNEKETYQTKEEKKKKQSLTFSAFWSAWRCWMISFFFFFFDKQKFRSRTRLVHLQLGCIHWMPTQRAPTPILEPQTWQVEAASLATEPNARRRRMISLYHSEITKIRYHFINFSLFNNKIIT